MKKEDNGALLPGKLLEQYSLNLRGIPFRTKRYSSSRAGVSKLFRPRAALATKQEVGEGAEYIPSPNIKEVEQGCSF